MGRAARPRLVCTEKTRSDKMICPHARWSVPSALLLVTLAGCAASSHSPPAAAPAAESSAQAAPQATGFTTPRPRVAIVDGKDFVPPDIAMGSEATNRAILEEGKHRNQVMDHLKHLTLGIGPRLTGSERLRVAKAWTRERFEGWGLSNVRLEPWGTVGMEFDRGPTTGKVFLREEKKNDDGTTRVEYTPVRDMTVSSLAWTPGTNGPQRGRVVKMPETEEEYAKVKDQLKGAWVLMKAPPAVGQRGIRSRIASAYEARKDARERVAKGEGLDTIPIQQRVMFDGILGYISTSRDERVWSGSPTGWREFTPETLPKEVHASIRGSDYDFINSRLIDGEPIEVELDMPHVFKAGPITEYNVIAEIPGTVWPEQVVIVSAHLDSWDTPGNQGTTDNGTGSAVTLEAARILMAVGAKPKRTIKFILWTGEEQGLLGARAYVEQQKANLGNISAMFNDDGGTNSQGGIPVAEQMIPMLAAATSWTNYQFFDAVDGKWLNVNLRPTGRAIRTHSGSDHAAFNAVGVPGFFWDEVGRADYGFTWHTQHDQFQYAIDSYLKQSSTNSALVAYNLACMDTLLPRSDPEAKAETTAGPRPQGTQMPAGAPQQ
jgi:carboxypeptidase Q